jgi:hypothetical protein
MIVLCTEPAEPSQAELLPPPPVMVIVTAAARTLQAPESNDASSRAAHLNRFIASPPFAAGGPGADADRAWKPGERDVESL